MQLCLAKNCQDKMNEAKRLKLEYQFESQLDIILNSYGLYHIGLRIYNCLDKKSLKVCRLVSKASKYVADQTLYGLRLQCLNLRSRFRMSKFLKFHNQMERSSRTDEKLGYLFERFETTETDIRKLKTYLDFMNDFVSGQHDNTAEDYCIETLKLQKHNRFTKVDDILEPFEVGNGIKPLLCQAIISENIDFLKILFAERGFYLSLNQDFCFKHHNILSNGKMFHLACFYDKMKVMKLFFETFNYTKYILRDFNAFNDCMQTPFHIACENGSLEMVKLFLEYRETNVIDINARNLETDYTFGAILKGRGDAMDRLKKCNRKPALALACENGHLEVVKFILNYAVENGLDLDLHGCMESNYFDDPEVSQMINQLQGYEFSDKLQQGMTEESMDFELKYRCFIPTKPKVSKDVSNIDPRKKYRKIYFPLTERLEFTKYKGSQIEYCNFDWKNEQ